MRVGFITPAAGGDQRQRDRTYRVAVIGKQVDLGVDDGVFRDVAGARKEAGAHPRALVFV